MYSHTPGEAVVFLINRKNVHGEENIDELILCLMADLISQKKEKKSIFLDSEGSSSALKYLLDAFWISTLLTSDIHAVVVRSLHPWT